MQPLQEWSQFGLTGLIIGACFVGFGIVGKYILSQLKKNADSQHEFLIQVVGEHRSERKEWREAIQQITKDTTAAVERNTAAINQNTEVLTTLKADH